MQPLVIDGRIKSVGASTKRNILRNYDYVTFVDRKEGKIYNAPKVAVSDNVDRLVYPGADGLFYMEKSMGTWILQAAKVGDDEADDFRKGSSGCALVFMWSFIFIVVLFAIGVGGAPGILFGGVALVLAVTVLASPGRRSRGRKRLKKLGFTLDKSETI